MRHPASRQTVLAVVAAATVALPACGGGSGDQATFSATALDSIGQGDTADAVRAALGEPETTEDLGRGAELWIYCDGSAPRYLVLTDGLVSIESVQPPDELRVVGQSCG